MHLEITVSKDTEEEAEDLTEASCFVFLIAIKTSDQMRSSSFLLMDQ